MSTQLLLATHNRGKVAEFQKLFQGVAGLTTLCLQDIDEISEVVEDGETFEANARKKAFQVAQTSGMLTLADDSGLEVDALGGAPGVYSARFAGENATDEENNRKLLNQLTPFSDRQRRARFVCVLALAEPKMTSLDQVHIELGACEGVILTHPRGERGFGYDPIFLPQGYDQTMAELPPEQKNQISHRARAASKMRDHLCKRLA